MCVGNHFLAFGLQHFPSDHCSSEADIATRKRSKEKILTDLKWIILCWNANRNAQNCDNIETEIHLMLQIGNFTTVWCWRQWKRALIMKFLGLIDIPFKLCCRKDDGRCRDVNFYLYKICMSILVTKFWCDFAAEVHRRSCWSYRMGA